VRGRRQGLFDGAPWRLHVKRAFSILLLTAMHDSPHDVVQKPLRGWRVIAEELMREPNTGRMGMLLNELIRAFEGQPLPREKD
jgi:hypothetical protein